MALVGLIPARGGSKVIPRKNLANCAGRPLLAWTASAALGSGVLDRVVLSTDDDDIAEAGRMLGLDVPFMRPDSLSGDTTPMLPILQHALGFLRAEGLAVEAIVLLQPTSPLRTAQHIVEAVSRFRASRAATLVSTVLVPHRYVPSSLMREVDGALVPMSGAGVGPVQRQDKEQLLARNGPAVLIVRPEALDANLLYGTPTVGYLMDERSSIDVDTAEDLALAELLLRSGQ